MLDMRTALSLSLKVLPSMVRGYMKLTPIERASIPRYNPSNVFPTHSSHPHGSRGVIQDLKTS